MGLRPPLAGHGLDRHLPRRSIRVRLALACWGVFVLTGVPLLAVTVGLWQGTTGWHDSVSSYGAVSGSKAPVGSLTRPGPATRGMPAGTAVHEESFSGRVEHSFDLHQLLIVSGIALVIMTIPALVAGWLVAGAAAAAARHDDGRQEHLRHEPGRTAQPQRPGRRAQAAGDTFDDLLGRLERSFQSQRQFVANASHELRTPHATMRVWLDVALAKPGPAPPHIVDLGDRLRYELDHVDRLLDGLLVLARAQQRSAADSSTFPLDAVVSAAVAERATLISGKGLDVRHQECPGAWVTGSETLLARMVGNVVDNAIIHNEPGGWVRIRTGVAGAAARLTVENGGPVLDERDVQALTQPFRRLGTERTGSDQGSGLGLSIVAAIAEMHGGRLGCTRSPKAASEWSSSFPWR